MYGCGTRRRDFFSLPCIALCNLDAKGVIAFPLFSFLFSHAWDMDFFGGFPLGGGCAHTHTLCVARRMRRAARAR